MLPNILKDRVQLQEKTVTQTALGQTITWKPICAYYARVIPLDVKAIAAYQQLSTVVTHKILLRGTVEINLGSHRIVHGSKTYEPQSSAKHYENVTEIVVEET